MTQNAGRNQGGVNKAADKSADRKRKATGRSARHRSEAGFDPGTRTDGGVRSTFKGGRL
jgi:hypothetical protein